MCVHLNDCVPAGTHFSEKDTKAWHKRIRKNEVSVR